jgi:hypothetical protein
LLAAALSTLASLTLVLAATAAAGLFASPLFPALLHAPLAAHPATLLLAVLLTELLLAALLAPPLATLLSTALLLAAAAVLLVTLLPPLLAAHSAALLLAALALARPATLLPTPLLTLLAVLLLVLLAKGPLAAVVLHFAGSLAILASLSPSSVLVGVAHDKIMFYVRVLAGHVTWAGRRCPIWDTPGGDNKPRILSRGNG